MARRWIGFRLHAEPPFDALANVVLAPWLADRQRAGLIRRWFYLWYSESGFHLRLRLHVASAGLEDLLRAELEELGMRAGRDLQVRPQRYDRTELAFGETPESVLAELAHVGTSALALSLLPDVRGSASRRWLITAAAVGALVRRIVPAEDLDRLLAHWLVFAARAAERAGCHVSALRQIAAPTGLVMLLPRAEYSLREHRPATRSVQLMRRLCERGPRGRFVAIHALHLFCNEMGIWSDREYGLVAAIRSVCTRRFDMQVTSSPHGARLEDHP